MNRYWKYHLSLLGQTVVASIVYGALVFAIAYFKPAPSWRDDPMHGAWTLGSISAGLAMLLGVVILGSLVVRDQLKARQSY